VIFQREALANAGLTGSVEQANLFEWNPPVPADLVYEQTCLCALHPNQWRAYESALHRWLKPGGHLAAMFMQKEGEGGPPFHCGIDAMRNLFHEETWQWSEQLYRSEHQIGVCELAFLLTRR
jgi:trans-aconitate methyltransferase